MRWRLSPLQSVGNAKLSCRSSSGGVLRLRATYWPLCPLYALRSQGGEHSNTGLGWSADAGARVSYCDRQSLESLHAFSAEEVTPDTPRGDPGLCSAPLETHSQPLLVARQTLPNLMFVARPAGTPDADATDLHRGEEAIGSAGDGKARTKLASGPCVNSVRDGTTRR
jgi:hypothetical protein